MLFGCVICSAFPASTELRSAAFVCGSDHLLGHLTFGIVIILNGIDDNLGDYDLAGKFDISLGSADNSAFLILIIILFFARNVNKADDVSVTIVDIEKLRTS